MIFVRQIVIFLMGITLNLAQFKPVLAQSLEPSSEKTNNSQDLNPLTLPASPTEVEIQKIQPITLQEALELTESNNQELKVARLNFERSQKALNEAEAAQFPSLGINAELAVSADIDTPTDVDLQITSSPTTFLGGAIELDYNLFSFGKISSQIKAAKEQLRFDKLEVNRIREQIRLEIISAYYNLQEADEQVRINQAAIKNIQISLNDAKALEQGELGTRFDIVLVEVQLANAEQELNKAEVDQEIARRELAKLLNFPLTVDVVAADPVLVSTSWDLSLEESIILAFKNRVELEQQLALRNISNEQRQVAKAAVKPNISLFANYQALGEFNAEVEDGYAAGVRIQWNLFDGGAANAAASQEEINIKIAETRFVDTRNQIRLEVEKAFKILKANAKNLQTSNFALEKALISLEMARFRFRAGVGTQLEVNTAETELTQAEGNRVKAILNYNRAFAALKRAVSSF